MKTIFIIVGTRPEALKLIPVYFALQKEYDVRLISTGQHREMLKQIFQFFQVTPAYSFNAMTENQTLSEVTAVLFSGLNQVFENARVSLSIVQGDTTTAMVAAMVSYYHKVPVAHVEAGLRSNIIYSPFPEEINRRIITQIAEINFAPTDKAAQNLQGCKNVHVVGNTIVDSLHLALEKIQGRNDYKERFSFLRDDREMILVTAHRRESFGEGIRNICDAIRILAQKYSKLQFIYPVHLNPNISKVVHESLTGIESVFLTEPVNYDEMVYLMKKAKIILTDSGGVQEEAPALRVPVIVMREVTERPEGIESGCAILSGTTSSGIVGAFEAVYLNSNKYESMRSALNPYGDGKASKRIANLIRTFL